MRQGTGLSAGEAAWLRRCGRYSNGAAHGVRRHGSREHGGTREQVSTVGGAGGQDRGQDHYAVLGVGRDANPQVIHRAYRALARRYHPDVYGGHDAEPRFRKISAAYEVLHDPAKRALYDAVPARRRVSAEPARARSFPRWTAGRTSGDAPRFIDEEPECPVAGAPSAGAPVRVPWPGRPGLLFGCVIEVSDWRC